jgi:hypothetical protein
MRNTVSELQDYFYLFGYLNVGVFLFFCGGAVDIRNDQRPAYRLSQTKFMQ